MRSLTTTSSLVEPPDYTSSEKVDVRTLDVWSRDNAIDSVDVLKIDTEGHDLEVLAGAAGLLAKGAIRFVVAEAGFDGARQLVPFEAIRSVLSEHGMSLVGFYHQTMDWGGKPELLFADALFARQA